MRSVARDPTRHNAHLVNAPPAFKKKRSARLRFSACDDRRLRTARAALAPAMVVVMAPIPTAVVVVVVVAAPAAVAVVVAPPALAAMPVVIVIPAIPAAMLLVTPVQCRGIAVAATLVLWMVTRKL